MDAIEIIRKRRSVREYKDTPIPKGILEKIADAGRFAATARNIQPWEFIVITEAKILKRLSELAENGRFLAQASACIAIFSEDTKYYLEDGSAATQNMLLAATYYGVGSCWVAGDKKPYCSAISELLSVPAAFKLVSLIALGYPVKPDIFKPAEKKTLKEMLHWDKF